MVALQIRDVPDEIRDALAARAAARGQSLQAFLLDLVTQEAHRAANLALLERFGARQDGSRLTSEQVVGALHAARSEREAHLMGLLDDAS